MRRVRLLAVALLCGSASAEDGIEWRTDLAAAHAEAAKSGRPLVIVFR